VEKVSGGGKEKGIKFQSPAGRREREVVRIIPLAGEVVGRTGRVRVPSDRYCIFKGSNPTTGDKGLRPAIRKTGSVVLGI
jgi:hypothetical protein